MIRWSYIVTRSLFVVATCVVLWLLLNPALRWGLVYSGQSLLGSKVEIGAVATNLRSSRMDITDIAIADPNRSLRNLAKIDRASFDIETSSALKKRLIISEGRLSGVMISSERKTSGQLDKKQEQEKAGPSITDKVGDMGERWIDSSLERMEQQIEDDLQSVKLANDLKERWPQEYDTLEVQAKDLVDQGEMLVKKIETYSKNPLDHVDKLQQTFSEIDQLRRNATELKSRLSDVKRQIETDKTAIQTAKQHDEQYVREKLKFESLDAAALTEYLLGPELQEKVGTAIKWIQWTRSMTAAPESSQEATPQERGISVIFPSMRSTPDFLIRKLLLDGQGTVDGKPYQFSGAVRDITHQARRHSEPMTLEIAGVGAIQFTSKGTFDRRGLPKDQVEIDIPALALPARVLGKPEKISVHVSEGVAKINALVNLTGDDVNGTIHFVQPDVKIEPNLSKLNSKDILASDVGSSFQNIRNIEANIELGGTLRKPSWKLNSNLGDQLAMAFNGIVEHELAAREDQLVSMANQLVDKEISKFETQITQKHGDILKHLELGETGLSAVKSDIASLIGGKGNVLNKGKKLFDLLKR